MFIFVLFVSYCFGYSEFLGNLRMFFISMSMKNVLEILIGHILSLYIILSNTDDFKP